MTWLVLEHAASWFTACQDCRGVQPLLLDLRVSPVGKFGRVTSVTHVAGGPSTRRVACAFQDHGMPGLRSNWLYTVEYADLLGLFLFQRPPGISLQQADGARMCCALAARYTRYSDRRSDYAPTRIKHAKLRFASIALEALLEQVIGGHG